MLAISIVLLAIPVVSLGINKCMYIYISPICIYVYILVSKMHTNCMTTKCTYRMFSHAHQMHQRMPTACPPNSHIECLVIATWLLHQECQSPSLPYSWQSTSLLNSASIPQTRNPWVCLQRSWPCSSCKLWQPDIYVYIGVYIYILCVLSLSI